LTAGAEEAGEQRDDWSGISRRQRHLDATAWRSHWTSAGQLDLDPLLLYET